MPQPILLDRSLSWRQVGDVAEGAQLALSDDAQQRIRAARTRVEAVVRLGLRAYGVNTGVGALCDVVVDESKQAQLSRNIVMSHAVGVGPPLAASEVRAIMAAAINNFAHGFSGLRLEVVNQLLALLAHDCVPEVPALGSVGYLTHMAHIALVLIGDGRALSRGRATSGAEALQSMPLEPFVRVARVVAVELASVTGNPVVVGTPEEPRALSGANAVGAALGLNMDSLGIAVAEIAAMSERRMDRLVNPLVSNLPAFLATDEGSGSGFMIAQYTAVSLAADNRRLAAPASLDGGVTSGLQEDHLSHATPAALKLLKIIDNAEIILAIELLAATQAYELRRDSLSRAAQTDAVYRRVRALIPQFRDDRPLSGDIQRARELLKAPF